MNIQIFWQIVTVRNVPWAAVNLKGWHLGNPEKSIIGDQNSIISARLFICHKHCKLQKWILLRFEYSTVLKLEIFLCAHAVLKLSIM